jgi:hypothetical protein
VIALRVVLCWLALVSVALADCPQPSAGVTPLEEETLVVGTTALGLTPAKYKPSGAVASIAVIQVQTTGITYRLRGTPTVGGGAVVDAGSSFHVCGIDSITAFRAISSGSATLFITYYKGK